MTNPNWKPIAILYDELETSWSHLQTAVQVAAGNPDIMDAPDLVRLVSLRDAIEPFISRAAALLPDD